MSLDLERFLTRLLSTTEVSADVRESIGASEEIAGAFFETIDDMLKPIQQQLDERVGVRDPHGRISWFGERVERPQRATLISHDVHAALRGRLAIMDSQRGFDVLIASPAPLAASGAVRLLLARGDDLTEYDKQNMAVRAATFSVGHATLDFSDLPDGTEGEFHIQLFSADGDALTEPLVERFIVAMRTELRTAGAATWARPHLRVRATDKGRGTGTVKWFSPEKGFGFITPDNGGPDIFVHLTGSGDTLSLKEGTRVTFDIEAAGARPQAVDVRLLDAPSA
jgi:CspA family cold shock protein